jgi:hypothetical protein
VRTRAEEALRAELEERLRFEALLADLSARFVHVPADQSGCPAGRIVHGETPEAV